MTKNQHHGIVAFDSWIRNGSRLALRHFPLLVMVAAVVEIPIAALSVLKEHTASGWAFFLGVPAVALITPIGKVAALVALKQASEGAKPSFRLAYGAVLNRFAIVLVASALWLLGVFAGVAALVIPGIVLLIGGQCLLGAVVVERQGIRAAVERSWKLVRPVWFAVFFLFIVVELAGVFGDALVTAALSPLAPSGVVSELTVAIIARVLSAPLPYSFLAALFLERTHTVSSDS